MADTVIISFFTVDVSESDPLSSFGAAFVDDAVNIDLVNSNGADSGCNSDCDSGCDVIYVSFTESLNSLLLILCKICCVFLFLISIPTFL